MLRLRSYSSHMVDTYVKEARESHFSGYRFSGNHSERNKIDEMKIRTQ